MTVITAPLKTLNLKTSKANPVSEKQGAAAVASSACGTLSLTYTEHEEAPKDLTTKAIGKNEIKSLINPNGSSILAITPSKGQNR